MILELKHCDIDYFVLHYDSMHEIVNNGDSENQNWADFDTSAQEVLIGSWPCKYKTLINMSKFHYTYRPKWHRYMSTKHFFLDEGLHLSLMVLLVKCFFDHLLITIILMFRRMLILLIL